MLYLAIVLGIVGLLGVLYLLATRVELIKQVVAKCLFLGLEEMEERGKEG